jgi:hypothetical protein
MYGHSCDGRGYLTKEVVHEFFVNIILVKRGLKKDRAFETVDLKSLSEFIWWSGVMSPLPFRLSMCL